MNQANLSRELALRIGLAAKTLPGIGAEQWVQALLSGLDYPLDAGKLSTVTAKSLQQYFQMEMGLKLPIKALILPSAILRAELAGSAGIKPQLKMYRPEQMPNSIRVAVCSEDGFFLNGQFSVCKAFYIYQISISEQRLVAIRAAVSDTARKADDNLARRAEVLDDCQMLYCQTMGAQAAAKVIKFGVHPVTVRDRPPIFDVLEQLQSVLSHSPPPWLAKQLDLNQSDANTLPRGLA